MLYQLTHASFSVNADMLCIRYQLTHASLSVNVDGVLVVLYFYFWGADVADEEFSVTKGSL